MAVHRAPYLTRPVVSGSRPGQVRIRVQHPGQLNDVSHRAFGKRYFDLDQDERRAVLRTLKRHGKKENQLLGMMQVQLVYRKNQPDHVRSKAEADRDYIVNELYAKKNRKQQTPLS